jgi:hypothetical protein
MDDSTLRDPTPQPIMVPADVSAREYLYLLLPTVSEEMCRLLVNVIETKLRAEC